MIETYTINNLGLVAGICKELKIAEIVDQLIPPDSQQKITTGQAVVAMILNGLGFSNRTLYLFPQFFEKKPVALLMGEEIAAEHFNDDTIGRSLDRVFSYGSTELFSSLASFATQIESVDKKFGHLDTTTFSLHGSYDSSQEDDAAIRITYGASKLKRPDLKQIFLNLLVTSDGGIPLFMQVMDGNSSDNTIFRKTVTEFRKGIRNNLQEIQYWIADCKLYTDETIRAVDDDIKWISRVPDNIKEATREIENAVENLTSLQPMNDERYAYYTHESNYGGVLQRWLVIFSKEAQKRAEGTVQKAVVKEFADISVQSKKRGKKGFFCDADAQESIHIFQKKLKYHTISIASMTIEEKYKRRGRPSANSEKECLYQPQYCIEQNDETIGKEINKRSIFVVATNELSSEKLSDQEVFNHYKDQNKVEQGFRFLKDPLFFASSLFLKKPERIVALTMIMCLSLLVYSICERKLRLLLKLHGETIHSQVGKPTQRPTMRWIYQIFEDVHLVRISGTKAVQYEVTNLREDAVIVLNLLGEEYKKRYLLNQ